MKKLSTLLIAVLVAAGLLRMCVYTVNEREYALVFALGELKTVISEPGLHVKRIEDPRLYWVSFQGSEPAAANRVSALLRDVLNVVVNKRTVNQITSSERDKAMVEISQLLQERVRDVGIGIVDVRMKRVDFTPEISESVYRRMEAERKRVASEERSKGAAQAERIRASADRESEVILAQAYRDAQKVKGEGDAQAAEIYAEAFGRDPEFARFYRSLQAYRDSFADKNDVMVVDPSADFFRYFKSEKAQ